MPQGTDYFRDSKEALRMMIPLTINERNIRAHAEERQKHLDLLKERYEAETLRDIEKQKQEEEKAKEGMILKEYERRLIGNDIQGLQQIAPRVEELGVPIPRNAEGAYMGLPTKADNWQLKETEGGLMYFPGSPTPGAQPIPTGVMGKPQKWQVYPPGSGEGTGIAKTIDLGDRVRVFKSDGSFEDLAKNPTPTATEQSTRPPKGYRWNENKQLEAIPGGPADEKTQLKFASERASYESTVSELDRLQDQARQLMEHPGLGRITGLMGKIPNIPGSEAANAEAMLETLKSQTAFSVLQAMRNASKTGGALGQVSDKEGELLQNNLAALSKAQSYDAYRKSLQKIIDFTERAKSRMGGVFKETWKDRIEPGEKKPTTSESLQLKTADDYIKSKFGGD